MRAQERWRWRGRREAGGRTLVYHLSKPSASEARPSVANSTGRFSMSYSMRLYESLRTSEASLMR